MQVKLIRSKSNNIYIKVEGDSVICTAPYDASENDILKVLQANHGWIDSRVRCTNDVRQYCAESTEGSNDWLIGNKTVIICGEKVAIVPSNNKKSSLSQDGKSINIYQKHFSNKAYRIQEISKVIKKVAQEQLPPIIASIGSRLAICPLAIVVNNLNNEHWYSKQLISQKSGIYIDFRVVQLPIDLQHYVIAKAFCYMPSACDIIRIDSIYNAQKEQRLKEYQILHTLL